jgi:Zn-dependent protease with chaperone function
VGPLTDLLVESALHGVVSALAVELLIRRLPVQRLSTRARLRMAVLVFPVVSVLVLRVLAPGRGSPAFDDVSLLVSARWNAIGLFGFPARDAVFTVFSALGLAILLRDAIGDAAHVIRKWRHDERGAHAPWMARPTQVLRDLSLAMGIEAPALVSVSRPEPLLLCRGLLRPHIAVTEALVRLLRPEGLRAALAHELSHVRHGDPLRDVFLVALRTIQWFNPVAQVVARRITQETEWRADDEAVAVTGHAPALARALLQSVRARGGDFLGALGRARIAALELRCRRLLAPGPAGVPPGLSFAEGLAVGTAIVAMAVLVR